MFVLSTLVVSAVLAARLVHLLAHAPLVQAPAHHAPFPLHV
jgi:hypothetical protein